jgi:hypothetical protein
MAEPQVWHGGDPDPRAEMLRSAAIVSSASDGHQVAQLAHFVKLFPVVWERQRQKFSRAQSVRDGGQLANAAPIARGIDKRSEAALSACSASPGRSLRLDPPAADASEVC